MAELHTVPLVLTAKTVMVCLPAVIPMEAESELESVTVYFLVESTHTSIRARMPVTVDVACTSTGGADVAEPLAGAQIWTPADVGAAQLDGTVKLKAASCRVPSTSAAKMSP